MIFAQFDLGLAETMHRLHFAHQLHPLQAQHQHVVGAVGQVVVGGDPAEAGHRIERRPAFVILLPARRQHGHGDQPVVGQGVFEQIAVARLENVKRLHHVGKQHQVRQREEPNLARKAFGGERQVVER